MRKKTIIRSSIAIAMLAAVFVLIGSVLASNKKKNAEKTAVVAQTTTGDVAVKVSSVEKQVAGMLRPGHAGIRGIRHRGRGGSRKKTVKDHGFWCFNISGLTLP